MNTVMMRKAAAGVSSVLVAFIGWELLGSFEVFGQTLPTASSALKELSAMLTTIDTWVAIGTTLASAVIGLILATVVGVILGILIGTSEVLSRATRVVIEFLKPIPPIVVLPLVILVLGPKVEMAVFLVFFGTVIPILVQTTAGIVETDPVAIDTARSFRMSRIAILSRVVLPSATPFIGNALRVAAPTALIVSVVAGLFGGAPGIGYILMRATTNAEYETIFATVIIMGLLGLTIQAASVAIERRLLRWHVSYRTVAA